MKRQVTLILVILAIAVLPTLAQSFTVVFNVDQNRLDITVDESVTVYVNGIPVQATAGENLVQVINSDGTIQSPILRCRATPVDGAELTQLRTGATATRIDSVLGSDGLIWWKLTNISSHPEIQECWSATGANGETWLKDYSGTL